jgi:hypothetical protein
MKSESVADIAPEQAADIIGIRRLSATQPQAPEPGCPRSSGMRAHDAVETAPTITWNTHYTEMIMTTLAGWWFFREVPDRWTVLGVTILIACAIYISIRERAGRVAAIREFEQP